MEVTRSAFLGNYDTPTDPPPTDRRDERTDRVIGKFHIPQKKLFSNVRTFIQLQTLFVRLGFCMGMIGTSALPRLAIKGPFIEF